jgi:predicted O-methyltransferase YrrM
MDLDLFAEVDRYIDRLFAPADAALEAALQSSIAAGMPQIHISASQGKFLYLLARLCGAQRILEIGTLAGYSTIWLARALPAHGRLLSLEYDAGHAKLATANIARAGLAGLVTVLVGPALETLAELAATNDQPFDMIFVDADKTGYPEYLKWAIRLARPGSLILADNVVRQGDILDVHSRDESVQAARAFNAMLAAEPRLEAVVLQQVGAKGHDGLAMAIVKRSPQVKSERHGRAQTRPSAG